MSKMYVGPSITTTTTLLLTSRFVALAILAQLPVQTAAESGVAQKPTGYASVRIQLGRVLGGEGGPVCGRALTCEEACSLCGGATWCGSYFNVRSCACSA
jgi:hypothetical protein